MRLYEFYNTQGKFKPVIVRGTKIMPLHVKLLIGGSRIVKLVKDGWEYFINADAKYSAVTANSTFPEFFGNVIRIKIYKGKVIGHKKKTGVYDSFSRKPVLLEATIKDYI